ncbi:MAG: hypothetical protein MUE36_11665 [Acidimicrobiales bacterium]|nr:hypothetical protein [Acidimicrobiales bacterium]
MSAPNLVAPEPRQTLDPEAVARIERWAARQRSELTRLTLTLRSAEAQAAKAEAGLASLGEGAPDEVLAVVDARLARATADAEASVDAARRDAELVLAASAQHAATILRDAGLDPSPTLTRLGAEAAPDTSPPKLTPPARASELWRQAQRSPEVAAASAPPTPIPLGGRDETDPLPAAATAPSPERDDEAEAARVYELFWNDSSSERTARVRRRSERGDG